MTKNHLLHIWTCGIQFDKTYWNNTYVMNEFLSDFKLYYDGDELNNEINKLIIQFDNVYMWITAWFYSKTSARFERVFNKIERDLDDILELSMHIESKLIKNNIHVK